MTLKKRINALVLLGLFLKQFENSIQNKTIKHVNILFYKEFEELIEQQKAYNGWFTKENVIRAITEIGNLLNEHQLNEWISSYSIPDNVNKNIGVIMAGNIPLVGFHDFLCVLISGNKIQAKLASNDSTLIKKIGEILLFIEPAFFDKISFVDRLENFDAVIATGSNNTARYFHQYFSNYPHIIRKNRNAVAIINENDTLEDIKPLGRDVFQYFGLGCRSVSKLFLPKGYRIATIFEAFYDEYQEVTNNNKYANNYDYNKAVYLLGNNQLLDNGFILLKEDVSLSSPVGVLHYEYYDSLTYLQKRLEEEKNEIQCVVSSKNSSLTNLTFGQAQSPSLTDYADGIDTMKFLLELT